MELPKDQFKGFINENQTFTKKFNFSETEIKNEKVMQLMEVLIKKTCIQSTNMMKEKSSEKLMSNFYQFSILPNSKEVKS